MSQADSANTTTRTTARASIPTAEDWEAVRSYVDNMDIPCRALSDYIGLLCVLTANPDASTTIDGINRVLLEISDHAGEIRRQWDNLSARIYNPSLTGCANG